MVASFVVTPMFSEQYTGLVNVFQAMSPPYREGDVRAFGTIYARIYKDLPRDERQRAEKLVDLVIEGLERRESAALIYGVF